MPSTPMLPQAVWASGTNRNSIPANDNSLRQEILHGFVISQAITAQPGTPVEGDIYIIPATHTGAQWGGFTPNDLAIYKSGTWYAYAPSKGIIVNVAGSQFQYDGAAWVAVGGGASDGDKGDIVVSAGGTAWTIDAKAVSFAKVQDISAQYRLLGRNSASAGSAEEVTLSQLLDWVGSAANGDILFRSGGAWTRLPAGTNGQVLTVASGLPSWAAAAGGGMSNPMTTVGDMIVGGSVTGGVAAPTRVAAGTAAYVWTSNGPGVAPSWQAATGGSSGIVVNPKSADYTLVLGDANGMIYHPSADTTARTFTIPANASVAFPIGTAITFDNDIGAGSVSIAITTDTLVLVSAGTTGTRTLAPGGSATAIKVTSTRWRINGTGLT